MAGGRPWSRRAVLRAAAAVAALTGGGAVAACAQQGQASTAAGPTVAAPGITLLVSVPYQGFGSYNGTMQQLTDDYISSHWLPTHKGVTVKTMSGAGCNGSCLSAQSVMLNSIAGQPPDTVCGCCQDIQTYFSADVLLPLDTYIKRDNVDVSDFSLGHLQGLQQNGQQMALPQYDGPCVIIYSQSALDNLGLPYPTPDWTSTDAANLWRACTRKVNNKQITGASLHLSEAEWMAAGWGGKDGNADGTVCTLDSSDYVTAWSWFADLANGKVIKDGGTGDVLGGSSVFAMAGGWTIAQAAVSGTALKWDYLPMPKFPAGRASTFINTDFNGINALTKNDKDLVWDLFQFITMDPGFQQLEYTTTLVTPNRKSLWPGWLQMVRAVAPPLVSKKLETYQGALDYGVPTYFFKYQAEQANTLKTGWFSQILSGKVSAQEGLTQAAHQINALESTWAAQGPKIAAIQKDFPATGKPIAAVPTGI